MKLLISITLIFMALSCHKDTTKPVINNVKSSVYFPNTVGDYWEYEVYDSSYLREHPNQPRHYSVKVTITGTATLADGKDAYVWQYQYPYGNEIKYMREVKDSIEIFDTVYSKTLKDLQFPRQLFLIPFQQDKNWQGKLFDVDSFYVSSIPKLITSYATYSNCFDIYRHYLGPNMEYNDHYWFVPNVGFVKLYYHENNMGPTLIQVWQLKHYVLKSVSP